MTKERSKCRKLLPFIFIVKKDLFALYVLKILFKNPYIIPVFL